MWSRVLLILFSIVSILKSVQDPGAPLIEDSLEVIHHVLRNLHISSRVDGLGDVFEVWVVLLELEGVVVAPQCFFKLSGKLVEYRGELLLLLTWASAPVFLVESLNKRFIYLIDNGVE